MELVFRVKKYENIHIVFWLIKDSCWMLELRWLGTLAMFPTVFVAAWIVFKTRGSREMYINYAILFWILANSFWMMMEFFNDNRLKNYAGIPFALGFIFVTIYYLKPALKSSEL